MTHDIGQQHGADRWVKVVSDSIGLRRVGVLYHLAKPTFFSSSAKRGSERSEASGSVASVVR